MFLFLPLLPLVNGPFAEQQSLRTICRTLARKASREVNQQKLEKTVEWIWGVFVLESNPPQKKAKIQVEPFACWKTWWMQGRHERISALQVVFNRKGSTCFFNPDWWTMSSSPRFVESLWRKYQVEKSWAFHCSLKDTASKEKTCFFGAFW